MRTYSRRERDEENIFLDDHADEYDDDVDQESIGRDEMHNDADDDDDDAEVIDQEPGGDEEKSGQESAGEDGEEENLKSRALE